MIIELFGPPGVGKTTWLFDENSDAARSRCERADQFSVHAMSKRGLGMELAIAFPEQRHARGALPCHGRLAKRGV